MLVGYARVSTPKQDPAYQLLALDKRGCEKVFTDRCGATAPRRPQLKATLDFLRGGDTLVVWKFDRLARSLRDLVRIGADLDQRGCQLVSLTEAIDTTSPGGRAFFNLFGVMAEFELDLIRERTEESYRAAKAAGRRWGRPSVFHDPDNVRIAQAMLRDRSIPRGEIAKHFGVSRGVIRRWFPDGDPDAFDGKQHRGRAA